MRRFWPDATLARWAIKLASQPAVVAGQAAKLSADLANIAAGGSEIAPDRRDRRFADPAWTSNPLLKRTVQTYLALGGTAEGLLADAALDWRDNTRLKFVLTNLIAASAPSNNPFLSPDAWKAAIDTRRPEPRPRSARLCVRHVLNPAHPDHGGARRVHHRQGHRGDAGLGGGPDGRLRTHPVQAEHADRAPVPAAHGPADDQQVLHHRSGARPQHARVLRRAGIPGVRDLLAEPRPVRAGLGCEHLRRGHRGRDADGPGNHASPPRSTSSACAPAAS